MHIKKSIVRKDFCRAPPILLAGSARNGYLWLMAKKNALLDRLQQAPTPSSSVEPDRPTPPKPSPVAKSGSPSTFSDTTVEEPVADLRASVAANAADTPTPITAAKVDPPVTDPHEVWSRLLRSPQGIKLTDPRIHSLSPQRFDAVLLETLKSAFLAGWDARKGVEK